MAAVLCRGPSSRCTGLTGAAHGRRDANLAARTGARCSSGTGSAAAGVCSSGRLARLAPLRATPEGGPDPLESASGSKDFTSDDEVSKMSSSRRQAAQSEAQSSNPVMGALQEAQLITWPKPQKALVDTVLVLGIVTASGILLFSLNVALSELSDLFYHR